MIVKCAEETENLYTLEDHSIIGGIGSAVSEVLTDESEENHDGHDHDQEEETTEETTAE